MIYVTARSTIEIYTLYWECIPALRMSKKDLKMKVNEGVVDRGFRVVAGLVLIGLAASGTVGAWGYIGVIPLVTGAVGMCPIYSLLGISTCPAPRVNR